MKRWNGRNEQNKIKMRYEISRKKVVKPENPRIVFFQEQQNYYFFQYQLIHLRFQVKEKENERESVASMLVYCSAYVPSFLVESYVCSWAIDLWKLVAVWCLTISCFVLCVSVCSLWRKITYKAKILLQNPVNISQYWATNKRIFAIIYSHTFSRAYICTGVIYISMRVGMWTHCDLSAMLSPSVQHENRKYTARNSYNDMHDLRSYVLR